MWKIGKKRYHPLWPWPWPCDLDTAMVSWPCLGLPTRWIWWPNIVIKGVEWCVKGMTFDLEYLTLRVKIQNSAALRFCVWPFCTCLCIFSLLGWKLYDKFEKMSKNGQNWPVYRPWWPWPWPSDLDHSTRKSLFLRCIHLPSFVEMGKWERGQNPVTDVYNVLPRWLQRSYTIVKNSLFGSFCLVL